MPWKTGIEVGNPKLAGAPDAIGYVASVTAPNAETLAFLDHQNYIVAVRPYLAQAMPAMPEWLPGALTAHGASRVAG